MDDIQLGNTGLRVSPIGFGAFKIGRNQQIKYREQYEIPDEQSTNTFLNQLLDMGINYIDTAPAYGLSEERIGTALKRRRREYILSTKTGEIFTKDGSHYDYSHAATIRSIHQSLQRLKTDYLDIVYIHSNGRDAYIQSQTEVVEAMQELKSLGLIRHLGFSGKTVEGARLALNWADVIMVEYHLEDYSHAQIMSEAAKKGIGIVVKKGLASGNLPAGEAIRFVLGNPDVHSLVIGGLNINHIKQNLDIAKDFLTVPAV